MATVVNAVDVVVTFKPAGAPGEIVVGCAQSFSFTESRAMDPVTCSASNGHAQASPGLISTTGNISAVFRELEDDETGVVFDDVHDLLHDGTLKVGGKRYTGPAYINNLTFTRPDAGAVTWSADLTFNGPITIITGAPDPVLDAPVVVPGP
jgi:hypothetical protein